MKHPLDTFGRRRGFHIWRRACGSHADKLGCPSTHAGTNSGLSDYVSGRGAPMPPWLEVLLNVIGFAGFIGIAKYHRAPGGKLPDR